MVDVHTRSVCHRRDFISGAGEYYVLKPAGPLRRTFGSRNTTPGMVPTVNLSARGQSVHKLHLPVPRQWPVGLLINVAVLMWVAAILVWVFWPTLYALS